MGVEQSVEQQEGNEVQNPAPEVSVVEETGNSVFDKEIQEFENIDYQIERMMTSIYGDIDKQQLYSNPIYKNRIQNLVQEIIELNNQMKDTQPTSSSTNDSSTTDSDSKLSIQIDEIEKQIKISKQEFDTLLKRKEDLKQKNSTLKQLIELKDMNQPMYCY